MPLNTDPNVDAPDEVYQLLVDAHRDLTPDQSRLVNAKLILLLANHIGDQAVLAAAVDLARAGMTPRTAEPDLQVSA